MSLFIFIQNLVIKCLKLILVFTGDYIQHWYQPKLDEVVVKDYLNT